MNSVLSPQSEPRNRAQLDDEVARCQSELRNSPNDPVLYQHLARALEAAQRDAEAVLCYRQVVRLNPKSGEAHRELGNAIRSRPGTTADEPIACYREAIRLDPSDAEAYRMLGLTLKDTGLMDEAIDSLRRACELRPDSSEYRSSLLYCLHFHAGYDSRALAREHDEWHKRHAAPLASLIRPHTNEPNPHRRLRVGYVSRHLRHHPVGRFMLPILEAHDHQQFEIVCFTSHQHADDVTARLRGHADLWHDMDDLTDDELAELIRHDRIDILVDLDVHMIKNRMLTFARKPAPVQVTYLAYCSTTGLKTIDYRLTDPYLDPLDRSAEFVEEAIRLPETYWCYEPIPNLPVAGPSPASNSGKITFGCLNNFWKASPAALEAWRELLKRVPQSRLMLHARPGLHCNRVREFLAEQSIDPDRLEFVGTLSPLRYFQQYQKIDIALDPFPYPGGTTTCDALWMGVPVVSLAGAGPVNRAGVSILSNVGLRDLVAQTPQEYVAIASRLAGDSFRLQELRRELQTRMLKSPLTDGPRFTRYLERAYRGMWQRWCSSR